MEEDSKENDEDVDDDIILSAPPSGSLMFVYQTDWMKRLLLRYGNEMCLLDATYKTTRYALPLFFVVVKTNVDYQVVAIFVCEGESTQNILSALQIIKDWNSGWAPLYAMVDCCAEEINALESLFAGMYKDSIVTILLNKK